MKSQEDEFRENQNKILETLENMLFQTEEEKLWAEDYLNRMIERNFRICVIYTPDCKCNVEQFVVLDRYPMSEKIHSVCPVCNKGCLMEISDPIIFHCPWNDTDLTIDDLKKMKLMDSPQKPYLKLYIMDNIINK